MLYHHPFKPEARSRNQPPQPTMKLLLWSILVVAAAVASDWNYDAEGEYGPDSWPDECVLAESTHQSPINIVKEDVMRISFDDFSFTGYQGVDVMLANNLHTVQATLRDADNALLSGGGLDDIYELAQFHFHWGSNSSKGSEHLIDGVQYPMEVHFVHFNSKYGSLSAASSESDGLAVLSWVFQIRSRDNIAYRQIFDELSEVQYTDSGSYHMSALDLTQLMGNTEGHFYRYQGSLTTPPCSQTVNWTVFTKPIKVSERQMRKMRRLMGSDEAEGQEGHHLYNNFRPLQNLNDRTVFLSKR